MGFFSEWPDLPDDELARRLSTHHLARWGELPAPDEARPSAELLLLSQDESRVWSFDPECGAVAGNDVYADALRRLAEISRGAFDPKDVEESWTDGEGPRVSFTLDGTRHEISLRDLEDWFDASLIATVNELLAPDAGRFHTVGTAAEGFRIVHLTDREKGLLATRGLHVVPVTREGLP